MYNLYTLAHFYGSTVMQTDLTHINIAISTTKWFSNYNQGNSYNTHTLYIRYQSLYCTTDNGTYFGIYIVNVVTIMHTWPLLNTGKWCVSAATVKHGLYWRCVGNVGCNNIIANHITTYVAISLLFKMILRTSPNISLDKLLF